MTRREPLIRIHHMLDHAKEAVALLGDRSRSELVCDRTLNLAGQAHGDRRRGRRTDS
jgi:hypothetical protein